MVTDDENVTAHIVVTVADTKALSRYLLRHRSYHRYRFWLMVQGGVFGVTAGIAARGDEWGAPQLGAVACYATFLLAVMKARQASLSLTTQRLDFRVHASPLGLTAHEEGGQELSTPWTAFAEVQPGEDRTLLRLPFGVGMVLPNRCFAAGDVDRLLDFARAARSGQPPLPPAESSSP